MTNTELAAGLRELADFYETHPDMPIPTPKMYTYFGFGTINGPEILRAIRRQMRDGGSVVEWTDPPGTYPQHHVTRKFGAVTLDAMIYVGAVGRKVAKPVETEVWEIPAEEPEVKATAEWGCEWTPE